MKRIAHITDVHLKQDFPIENDVDAEQNWNSILEDIRSNVITDIVFSGDIGEVSSYDCFFKTLESFNWKIALGNHDTFDDVIKYIPLKIGHTKELYY